MAQPRAAATPAKVALEMATQQLEGLELRTVRSVGDGPQIAQAAALLGIGHALIEIAGELRALRIAVAPIRETPWQARERQQEGATS